MRSKATLRIAVSGEHSPLPSPAIRTSARAPSSTRSRPGAGAQRRRLPRVPKLDARLHLVDSPGVVFPSAADRPDGGVDGSLSNGRGSASTTRPSPAARLTLLNALPPKQIDDPVPAITLLLQRVAAQPDAQAHLETFYGLTSLVSDARGDRTTDFLVQVARRRGRLGKGGVPNLDAAARSVLSDWRDGRIGGWVEVPEEQRGESATVGKKEIVASWGKEFVIEGLWGERLDGSGKMEES